MRQLGSVLMAAGLVIGGIVGVGLTTSVTIPGVPWLVAVGLVKLTLLAAVGLIASGAALQRLAKRNENRSRLAS